MKRTEIGRRPRGAAVGHDAAPVHLKGAEQRLRPVPRVLELPPAPPAGAAGRSGKRRSRACMPVFSSIESTTAPAGDAGTTR